VPTARSNQHGIDLRRGKKESNREMAVSHEKAHTGNSVETRFRTCAFLCAAATRGRDVQFAVGELLPKKELIVAMEKRWWVFVVFLSKRVV